MVHNIKLWVWHLQFSILLFVHGTIVWWFGFFKMQINTHLFFSIIYDKVHTYNSETLIIAWIKKSEKKIVTEQYDSWRFKCIKLK